MRNSAEVRIGSAVVGLWASVAFGGSGLDVDLSGGSGRSTSSQSVRVRFHDPAQCLRVIARGVCTRNAPPAPPVTAGAIVLPLDAEAKVVWAGLYWEILGESAPGSVVRLNGKPVGAEALPVNESPCWLFIPHSFPYFADVTSLVRAGTNDVENLDDSGDPEHGYQAEGASLVVIYESTTPGAAEIVVLDGNDTLQLTHPFWELPIAISEPTPVAGTVIFIGGDGQGGLDDQGWDGQPTGDGDDFDCSDSRMPGALPVGWDTDEVSVVFVGEDRAFVSVPQAPSVDCVSWIATIAVVGSSDCDHSTGVIRRNSWGTMKRNHSPQRP